MPRLRCTEPTHGRQAGAARSRGSRSPASWSSRRLGAADVDRGHVPALLLCELRCDSDGRATRGRASTALRPRRDRAGVDAVGHRPGAGRRGSSSGVRLVGHVRGGDPVARAGALGAGGARHARRPWPVADRDRRPRGADRDWPSAAGAAEGATRGASICRGQCNAVMAIAVDSSMVTVQGVGNLDHLDRLRVRDR
jgi:hypothetical protein